VTVVSALLLAACGGAGSPSSPRTVTVVTTADLDELDTWAQVSSQQELLLRNVFQTLLTVGPDAGEPQNDLAESCRFSAPTAYTCRLKDAGFPDGTRVQPADVAWTFIGRHGTNSAADPDATRLRSLIGSVQTVDDHTVTLELTRPDASLPYLLTLPAASIVRNGYNPATAARDSAFGSGPYWVESEGKGKVVLVANPHYSSAGTMGNERVVIRRVPTESAGLAAVAAGSADLFYPGNERQSRALVDPGTGLSELTRDGSFSTTVLALDRALPNDSERPVRQALAALLDRDALAGAADESIVSLFSVLPNNVQWSTGPGLEDVGPDPARAAELLRGAGVTTPVPLRIARPPEVTDALWDELVRQLQDRGLFALDLTDSNDAARAQTESPATSDPLAYLSLVNVIDRSTELTDLISRARSDTDLASREQSVIDAQDQVADRSLAIPLWQDTSAVVTRAGVERVSVSPFLRLWPLRPPE